MAQCTDCDAGSYTATEGQSECLLCAAGYYASETAATECMPCDAGTYAESEGTATFALTCPEGYASSEAAVSCDFCAEGYGMYEGTCQATTVPQSVGDILVTEFMARSQGGGDPGEWVEIYNPTGVLLDLTGCLLRDDDSDHHQFSELLIGPGEYLVLARSGDPVENHGLEPDYVYSGFSLANTADEIAVECGGVTLDHVAYTGGDLVRLGESTKLDPGYFDAMANDYPSHWCFEQTEEYGTDGLKGSPGLPNPACATVGWCRLQFPEDLTEMEGIDATFYMRLYEAGLSDISDGVDVGQNMVIQFGYGPDASNPDANAEWQWLDSVPNEAWSASAANEPNNDEYMTTLPLPEIGTYDFAFRVSVDSGQFWTFCDRDARGSGGGDGSADGYQIDNAGNLVTTDNPCIPDVCNGNGECDILDGTCTCDEGWAGDYCDLNDADHDTVADMNDNCPDVANTRSERCG